MIKVMAVILNYNTIEDSKKCALLLKKQKGTELYVTIVDNNSSDGKICELRQFCDDNGIILIENKENKGFSAGNNIGLKKATEYGCKYALVINPDVEVRDEDFVCEAVKTMESDNNIAVLGPDVINMKGQHQNPMREVRYWEEVLWPIILIRNKMKKSLPYICDYTKSGYCEKVSGCCFCMRMNFAEKIGYLDEKVFLYCEEPILAATVKREGMHEYYKKNIIAYHMHKESEKGNSADRLKVFFKSRKYYLRKYSGYGKVKLAIVNKALSLQEKMTAK